MDKLWICGQYIETNNEPPEVDGQKLYHWAFNWTFIGVFDTEQKAKDACIKDYYFIFPAELNVALPEMLSINGETYYPNLEDKHKDE